MTIPSCSRPAAKPGSGPRSPPCWPTSRRAPNRSWSRSPAVPCSPRPTARCCAPPERSCGCGPPRDDRRRNRGRARPAAPEGRSGRADPQLRRHAPADLHRARRRRGRRRRPRAARPCSSSAYGPFGPSSRADPSSREPSDVPMTSEAMMPNRGARPGHPRRQDIGGNMRDAGTSAPNTGRGVGRRGVGRLARRSVAALAVVGVLAGGAPGFGPAGVAQDASSTAAPGTARPPTTSWPPRPTTASCASSASCRRAASSRRSRPRRSASSSTVRSSRCPPSTPGPRPRSLRDDHAGHPRQLPLGLHATARVHPRRPGRLGSSPHGERAGHHLVDGRTLPAPVTSTFETPVPTCEHPASGPAATGPRWWACAATRRRRSGHAGGSRPRRGRLQPAVAVGLHACRQPSPPTCAASSTACAPHRRRNRPGP